MKNLSLNQKIIGLIGLFFLGNLIIATVGILKIQTINKSLNELVGFTAKRLFIAKDLESITHQIRNREKVFILEDNQEGMKKQGQQLDDLETLLKKELTEYELIATENGKKDIARLREITDEWKAISLELRKYSMAGQNKEAVELARGKSRIILEKFAEINDAMVKRNQNFMKDEAQKTDELVRDTIVIISLVSLTAILIGSTLAFIILRSTSKAIDDVINNLNDSSNQVASASSQIAASSEELSQATTEQAASLEETASSVEEMSSMINRNTDNARQASESSLQCQRNAMKGKETVNEMIQSIDEINDSNNRIMEQINHSNAQLADIVKVISEIENKTKVINDIVFQTKLLSFNASVEAARAGEHGKGFAVVAEEVGNLAQMSGNAAKEISTMLEESIHKVESIVTETKTSVDRLISDGKRKVENGTRVAKSCGVVLDEIVDSVSKVSSMAEEISTASVEQSQGITEITKAMHQLDQVTQQNASASHEAASSAEELSAQAESLKSAVGILITTIKGGEQRHDQYTYAASTKKATSSPALAKASSASVSHGRSENVINMNKAKMKTDHKMAATTTKKTGTESDKTPSYNDDRFTDV